MLLKLWTVAALECGGSEKVFVCVRLCVYVFVCLGNRVCRDTLCLKHSALHSIPYT